MSGENGKTDARSGFIGRFLGLAKTEPTRERIIRPVAKPAPTDEEILHALLSPWAKGAPAAFDQHLATVVEAVHALVEKSRTQHAEMNYWTGYERAIRDLRMAFKQWTEPNAGSPSEGPLGGPNG